MPLDDPEGGGLRGGAAWDEIDGETVSRHWGGFPAAPENRPPAPADRRGRIAGLLGWHSVKLPNGDRAVVDFEKLQSYCLNPQHPRGRHKARVFAASGIFQKDAELLRRAILDAAHHGEADPGVPSIYGPRFVLDFDFHHRGRTTRLRTAWLIRAGEDLPRMTTCYVL